MKVNINKFPSNTYIRNRWKPKTTPIKDSLDILRKNFALLLKNPDPTRAGVENELL